MEAARLIKTIAVPANCIEESCSLRIKTAPNIPVIGSKYKNKAVFVCPILGIANS